MRMFMRTAVVCCLVVLITAVGAPTAGAEGICPAGGVMIMVDVDKEKAIEWFDDERLDYLLDEENGWSVTTFSSKTKDIGAVWNANFIFYGVADDDEDEVSERDMNKAFGNDLDKLRDAVRDEFRELYKNRVVDIEGDDVAKIADAVGLGTLSLDGDEWVLKASDCEALTVNIDEVR